MGKVVSQSELVRRRGEWERNGKAVVCAIGSFDLLHPGHIRLLEQARSLGDILVVLVRSDASVRARRASGAGAKVKSSGPATPAAERAEILAALAAVDYAVEFDEASPRAFLAQLAPAIMAKGGDPRSAEPASREDDEFVAAGCEVVRIPLEPGYSRALLIERITRLPA
ncbi:MAG: adenylyltransferase/cytidyltransferase family protein [Candidatus Acidiferrales bacterium]